MRPASDWRETPYPGERPDTSFVQVDDVVLTLQESRSGVTVDGADLDAWLLARGESPMARRVPVLAYGSNACPSKLVTMRDRDGLSGSVVMTACTVEGWAAAWCDGYRRDGAVPATLVEAPGSSRTFSGGSMLGSGRRSTAVKARPRSTSCSRFGGRCEPWTALSSPASGLTSGWRGTACRAGTSPAPRSWSAISRPSWSRGRGDRAGVRLRHPDAGSAALVPARAVCRG